MVVHVVYVESEVRPDVRSPNGGIGSGTPWVMLRGGAKRAAHL